jgi:anthranilate phosphoribosyltransferase
LNAGAALIAADVIDNMTEGIQRAADVIDSGAALAKLDALVDYSKQLSAIVN